MNLRNWTKDHTKGIFIGLLSPFVFVPLVMLLLSWIQHLDYEFYTHKFLTGHAIRSKIISLGIISNLLWFYIFLNKERYGIAMGIILATICFLPYVLYVNVFC